MNTKKKYSEITDFSRIFKDLDDVSVPSHQSPDGPVVGADTCPPGMEFLIPTSKIFVDQRVGGFGFHHNCYDILDAECRRMYIAVEEDGGRAVCMGNERLFTIYVRDPSGAICLRLKRTGNCYTNRLEVYTGMDFLLGRIIQRPFTSKFGVFDPMGNQCLTIEGGCRLCACGGGAKYGIKDHGGMEIGVITKESSGLLREMFSSADVFRVKYHVNLDSNLKTLILAAVFLIDFMYSEERIRRLYV